MTRRRRTGAWQFARDTSGAVAILVALTMPVVVGMLGLGAEASWWYMTQRKMQHIADVAAYSGAVRLRAGDDASAMQGSVLSLITASGYPAAANAPQIVTPYGGSALAVEVTLTYDVPRLFSALFFDTSMAMEARAVAEISPPDPVGCVTVLSEDASGALTVWGSAQVTVSGCDVISNSSASDAIDLGNDLTVSGGCIYTPGGLAGAHNLTTDAGCTGVQTLTAPVTDPHAGVTPPTSAACGTVWNGLTVRCHADYDLEVGTLFSDSVYIISGHMDSRAKNGETLTASNVSFVFEGAGYLGFSGNDLMHLSAPASGPLEDILFFGRQPAATNNTLRGTVGTQFNGTAYFPDSNLDFSGNSGATCASLVANTILFTGNSEMNCTGTGGGSADLSTRSVALTE